MRIATPMRGWRSLHDFAALVRGGAMQPRINATNHGGGARRQRGWRGADYATDVLSFPAER